MRTDGVPIAWLLFGNVETAGAYVPRLRPPLSSLRSTESDVFCPVLDVRVSTNVTL